jgi:hypothetical protein
MKRKYSYILVGIVYLALTIWAALWDIRLLSFFLAVPWSLIFAVFSPLIGHMFGYSPFVYMQIVGALLNLLIFFKQTLLNQTHIDQD